jgi:LacI family transcriptional regulator
MQRKVTVYDIASELNISASTVSRVLNNSALIGDEKRKLILDTAERLGYQKRPIRRQKGRSILNVALFLPSAGQGYLHLFYDPAELLAGLQEGLGDVTVNVITSLNDPGTRLFEHKKLGDIDGCIFGFTTPESSLLERIEEREVPVALINRRDEERNYVCADDEAGMDRLLGEMRARGRAKRPCYVGFAPIREVTDRRRRGFLEACERHGCNAGPADCRELGSLEELDRRFVGGLLDAGYDALMCFNDVVAVYLYQTALHLGAVPGRDFALTGFDDSPVRQLTERKIDTISLSVRELGHEAGGWLERVILDRDTAPMQHLVAGAYLRGETIAPGPDDSPDASAPEAPGFGGKDARP